MRVRLEHWKHNGQNAALALAFGLLAASLGMAMGRHALDWATIFSVVVSSYILADKRGWLVETTGKHLLSRVGDYVATGLYALLVILYVIATNDQTSPLIAPLYLPIVLAVICYKMRAGLVVSVGMAVVYAVKAFHDPSFMPYWHSLCALFSFPVVAAFVGVLTQRLEDRFHAMSDQTDELSALLDMSQMMNSAADLDTTLNLILLNVQLMSDCQVCAVYLHNPHTDTLELRAASGPRHRMALTPSLPVRDARSGHWTVEENTQPSDGVTAFYTADAAAGRASQSTSRLFGLDHRAGSFACIPLTSVEGLLGMLYVGYDTTQGLNSDGVHRLENLAVRTAASLQRAVMQQGFESLAYSDAMTGLDNFRRFEHDLGDELRRAERYDRALSVILLDIDHFKQFNDTLGHQAGDALLAQLATVLRDSLRSVDKPARYGGEEFVVLCPETGKDEARLIAERIRRNVEATAFALLGKDLEAGAALPHPGTTHVTVSVGYATFPEDAINSRELVKRADQALYAAKHAGRNTVRGYDELPAPAVAV